MLKALLVIPGFILAVWMTMTITTPYIDTAVETLQVVARVTSR